MKMIFTPCKKLTFFSFFFALLLLFGSCGASKKIVSTTSNNNEVPSFRYSNDDIPLDSVDVEPVFMGAEKNSKEVFLRWVRRNITYPATALENKMSGTASIKFVIDRNGEIRDLVFDDFPGRILAAEVVRVIKSAPKWTPGMKDGKPVSVNCTAKIVFSF